MAIALVETMSERDQLAAQCVQLGQQCASVVAERDSLNTELALAREQNAFLDEDRDRFVRTLPRFRVDVESFLNVAAHIDEEPDGEAL